MDSLNPSSPETFKILLVDDEPGTLQLVRKILQADGHEVYEASDGPQAIELFESTRPDLVLLDVVIPKIDGLGVLQEIRRRDRLAGVIMVSALTSEQLAVKSMLSGADDYISKPFKLKTIRMHIRQVMDKVHLRRHNTMLQEQLIDANEKLRHYMAAPLVETLMASPSLPSLGGERALVTILFMDFCNFTGTTQNRPPDEVLHILNDYFALLATAIFENGGYMDKIMGDGFMALFNMPTALPDHATLAVCSALKMSSQVIANNKAHNLPMNIRVGIHTGEAVVGNIGTPRLMNYTAIGDAVNLAKRLEESSEPGQILISAATRNLLNFQRFASNSIQVDALGLRKFKGFENPIEVFHIMDHDAR
ncbi:MAG: adenylate/guanylate cyclase domain-containing protein [Caldilineaceae bacterium]